MGNNKRAFVFSLASLAPLLFLGPGLHYSGTMGIRCTVAGCDLGPTGVTWAVEADGDLVPLSETQKLGSTAKPVGQMLAGSGLVGAPSYSFGADTDTGWYVVTPGTIGLAVNGVLVHSVNGTPSFSIGGSNSANISLAAATGNRELGIYIDAMKGGKCKTLTESSATEFDRISIAQTAGSNYAVGSIQWGVLFSDATDQQVLYGRTSFSCANNAGTEDCAFEDEVTPVLYASGGGAKDDLACTISDVNGLSDMVGFSANCASAEMTQTSATICYFTTMPVVRTTTPQ